MLIIGWHRAVSEKPPVSATSNFIPVSVLIPFRNEETNLPELIAHLKQQTYQATEFILIDDASTDNSVSVLTKLIEDDARFKLIQNLGEGKKQAITTGVKQAKGEVIVTTDADCKMDASWISTLVNYFNSDKAMMLVGPVTLNGDQTFFNTLQQSEFASLIGSAAAGVALGMPFMCNGANLAYRKKAFEAVGGFINNVQVASGDDEFLMRAIERQYPGSIGFVNDERALVLTKAMPNVQQFVAQRLRWASKWRHNNIQTKVLALGLIFIHSTFLWWIFSIPLETNTPWQLAGIFILSFRMIFEFIFLKSVTKFQRVKWSWLAFVTLQVVYPLYVVLIGLFSNFMPNSWKGRKI